MFARSQTATRSQKRIASRILVFLPSYQLVSGKQHRHFTKSSPYSATTTYGWPQREQIAPAWTGAPQLGHVLSSNSPHIAQYFPPTGSAVSRSGRKRRISSTKYSLFVGQWGFGQNPWLRSLVVRWLSGRMPATGDTESPVDESERLNFFASFSITSSLSFVPSPCSNIESADCLQPTSAASCPWVSPASRRASFTLLQNSGFRFFKAAILWTLFYQQSRGQISTLSTRI